MKLNIISDGTTLGTIIQDENGNKIDNVVKIIWEADANNAPFSRAILTLVNVPVNTKTEGEISQ